MAVSPLKNEPRFFQSCTVKSSPLTAFYTAYNAPGVCDNISYTELNNRLKDEEQFIIDYFDSCMFKEVEPSFTELKKRFNDKFNSRNSRGGEEFYYYFDQFIEVQSKSRAWNQSMIDKHKRIEKGLQQSHPKLKFSDLSINMMQKILETWSKGLDGHGTYNDHISDNLSNFRTFVTWAKSKNCLVNEEFFALWHIIKI